MSTALAPQSFLMWLVIDELWREAIDHGWSVISTVTFRTADEVTFVAEC